MEFLSKAKRKISSSFKGRGRSSANSPHEGASGTRKEAREAAFQAEDDTTPPGTPTGASITSSQGIKQTQSSGSMNNSSIVSGGSFTSPTVRSPGPSSANNRTATSSSVNNRSSPGKPGGTPCKSTQMSSHEAAILDTLSQDRVQVEELRKLCWVGCPHDVRIDCWLLMCGHTPPDTDSRDAVVARKRQEYATYVQTGYAPVPWDDVLAEGAMGSIHVGNEDLVTMKQIRKDIPRTVNGTPVLQHPRSKGLLERVIYLWAQRHPACGYVQGMLDLILPFFFVRLAHTVCDTHRVSQLIAYKEEAEVAELLDKISDDEFLSIESDVYWLSNAFLGLIQENFTFDQAATHAMVKKLEAVVRSIDPRVANHIEESGIRFPEFAFRWMNCLLLRELSSLQALRLYDTYMAEGQNFSGLHVYVCAALVQRWSPQILAETDYGALMQFLQKPPTFYLQERDMDELVSQAYVHQQLFESAPHHLQRQGSGRDE